MMQLWSDPDPRYRAPIAKYRAMSSGSLIPPIPSTLPCDRQAVQLYGIHFRGIETEFDFFDRVADFYRSVRESFAALDQKPLRDFLLLAETEIVLQVPALDGYPEGVRLKAIADGIGRMETDAETCERACNRVRELAKLFDPAVTVETQDLPALKQAVASYLSERQRLDNDTVMASMLRTHFRGSRSNAENLQPLARLADQIARLGTLNQP